ncbi:Gfo/Idh/MocA family protein [Conexibacter sp. CPCC 206217]|uniref:Gfo/Idh/MocA family protein n=1 Tax=Conexibacter sp. CPCC 206217 TaxID=3064574 RepID=UPI0027161342|nr:Gfo/Idh/MocA family oxidoreductase [Conexibacter sp. CPCC 206217]MDO8211893.1 Gfo/Idh/MocA family oxidoreductase [Conexibacter sp. CPCC 206217]
MTRTTSVRWGILSTAAIADELIGPLRRSSRAELVAVASRDPVRAAAYARTRGIPASYGSYEQLLADKRIEAVYVPLPNGLHARWAGAALEAGKHVLCEKPLAATALEAEPLFARAAARGLVLAEAMMYRHHPQTALLQELVAERLGPLRSLHATFHYPIPGLERGDARADPALAGGALRDLGCYCVSLLNLLGGGEPVAVGGRARSAASGVDMGFAGTLAYAGGATASFDVSMDSAMSLWLVATGARGTLRVPNPYQPSRDRLWAPAPCPREAFLTLDGVTQTIAFDGGDPFAHELDDVSRAVRGDATAFVVPPHETLRTLRTIERLLAAAGFSPSHEPLDAQR